jgi:hypothetical protein
MCENKLSDTLHPMIAGSIASVRVCWPYVRSYPDGDQNSDLRARRLSAQATDMRLSDYLQVAGRNLSDDTPSTTLKAIEPCNDNG